MHTKILGIYFSTEFGNCFYPAIQLCDRQLTIRTNSLRETIIGNRYGYWFWNSDHIARWFGKHYPSDEEGRYPDMWEYKGWLGHHQYIS